MACWTSFPIGFPSGGGPCCWMDGMPCRWPCSRVQGPPSCQLKRPCPALTPLPACTNRRLHSTLPLPGSATPGALRPAASSSHLLTVPCPPVCLTQTLAERCPCLEALSLAHCTQFSDGGLTAALTRMLLRPAAPDGSSASLRRLDLSFTQVGRQGRFIMSDLNLS